MINHFQMVGFDSPRPDANCIISCDGTPHRLPNASVGLGYVSSQIGGLLRAILWQSDGPPPHVKTHPVRESHHGALLVFIGGASVRIRTE